MQIFYHSGFIEYYLWLDVLLTTNHFMNPLQASFSNSRSDFWSLWISEILWCDHSNESYWAVLSCGTVYYAVQGGSNFLSGVTPQIKKKTV